MLRKRALNQTMLNNLFCYRYHSSHQCLSWDRKKKWWLKKSCSLRCSHAYVVVFIIIYTKVVSQMCFVEKFTLVAYKSANFFYCRARTHVYGAQDGNLIARGLDTSINHILDLRPSVCPFCKCLFWIFLQTNVTSLSSKYCLRSRVLFLVTTLVTYLLFSNVITKNNT